MSGQIRSLDENEDLDESDHDHDDSKNQAAYNKSMNEPIVLNVGGMKYTTTKATLATIEGTFLYKMLIEGKFLAEPLKDGSYFIDRDGQHFRFILNFLRDSYVNIGDKSITLELLQEAMFYQIQPLIEHLKEMIQTEQIERIKSKILCHNQIKKLMGFTDSSHWRLMSFDEDKLKGEWGQLEHFAQGIDSNISCLHFIITNKMHR